MKILHIVRQFKPGQGGLENYVASLVSHQKANHSVQIVTLDRVFGTGRALRGEEIIDDVPVKRISFLGTRQCFLPFLNPFYLGQFDIVHIHGADQLLDLVAFYSLFCRKLRRGLFFTTHGLFFHTPSLQKIKSVYFRTISRFSLSRMQKIYAISGNDAEHLKKIKASSEILYNPIEPFTDIRAEGEDFVYIGRISANKRIDVLLDFYAKLREQKSKVGHLHIIGGDAENLRPDLETHCKRLGLTDHVTFHGFVSPEEMRKILSQCRYNISASRYEGFGLAMVEGMSAGLIPVMHNNAAFQEIKERSEIGFIGDFDKPDKTIQDFISWSTARTTEDHATDKEKAIKFALEQSYDKLVARLDADYRSVLEEAGCDLKLLESAESDKIRPLCGIPVNIETYESAITKIKDAVSQHEKLNVCFFNTNLAVQLYNHPLRAKILQNFQLILNDGIGTDIGSLFETGKTFPENLNGTDFTPALLRALPTKTPIALYGASDDVVKQAAHIIENHYGMKTVFSEDGYGNIADYRDDLKSCGAKILLVAMGNPKQEDVITHLNDENIDIPVMIGVGALFDFMTERFSRAPGWIQSLRLEWLYRLSREPKRLFKRYTIDIFKFLRLVRHYGNRIDYTSDADTSSSAR
ncbi:MAG: WecB/TagA/CpsF family glycosyltransferase [Pseudomonadota bacterium]